MNRGDVIKYIDMEKAEDFSMQRGMNYMVNGKDYAIILMSVRENAPYADRLENDGATIIYEGHDVSKKDCPDGVQPKEIDQQLYLPSGKLTENGKFYTAAKKHKDQVAPARKVKVYEKIKSGIWVYNGYFDLVDAFVENTGTRNVYKFKLQAINESVEDASPNSDIAILEQEHNRLIPTAVKVAVYARDKGRCVKCGATTNLHYDHILPFSKGGSSTTPDNIQLLCASCNLKKHDHIE